MSFFNNLNFPPGINRPSSESSSSKCYYHDIPSKILFITNFPYVSFIAYSAYSLVLNVIKDILSAFSILSIVPKFSK